MVKFQINKVITIFFFLTRDVPLTEKEIRFNVFSLSVSSSINYKNTLLNSQKDYNKLILCSFQTAYL